MRTATHSISRHCSRLAEAVETPNLVRREGLTPAPLKQPDKIIHEKGETSKTLLAKHEREVRALTTRHRKKSR